MAPSFTPYQILIALLWLVAGTGVAWYCAKAAVNLTYVTLADGRRQERSLPMGFRLLLPWTNNFIPLFMKSGHDKTRNKLNKTIIAAGFEGLLKAEEFLALKILVPLVYTPVIAILLKVFFDSVPGRPGEILQERWIMIVILSGLMLYVYPGRWLKKALFWRHNSIERALPFVLDLLTLSVEAGLDFMTSIQRIIENRKVDALGEELIRVFREVQLGKTRREALRDMADRVQQTDIRSVSHALTQADELGVSIGTILRIQADQMRIRRFQRAEKLANEAPVKMLFPLVAFIFPCVFIVLLGPVIMEFLKQGF